MATWEIFYQDEGWMHDRDAYFVKVVVGRDKHRIGIAVGLIDGLTWARNFPSEDAKADRWWAAAVKVFADDVADRIRHGEVRTEWAIGPVLEAPIDPAKVASLTDGSEELKNPLDLGHEPISTIET